MAGRYSELAIRGRSLVTHHSSLVILRGAGGTARGDKPKGGIKRPRPLNPSDRQGNPIARELPRDGRTNKPESNFRPRQSMSWATFLYPAPLMEGNRS